MHDWRVTTARLRAAVSAADNVPLDVERTLLAHYPVAIVRLSGLRIAAIKAWLSRHGSVIPSGLVTCADRRLRGGLVAWRGCMVLFVDGDDPEDEQQFTIAHEADHFLGDHLFPRMELLQRLGPSILPVLDGHRPPKRAEEVDALLARASLPQQIHMLRRDALIPAHVHSSEADADSFAREILAPVAAIEQQFRELQMNVGLTPYHPPANLTACPAANVIADYIVTTYGIPVRHARVHAYKFVAERTAAPNRLRDLGFE